MPGSAWWKTCIEWVTSDRLNQHLSLQSLRTSILTGFSRWFGCFLISNNSQQGKRRWKSSCIPCGLVPPGLGSKIWEISAKSTFRILRKIRCDCDLQSRTAWVQTPIPPFVCCMTLAGDLCASVSLLSECWQYCLFYRVSPNCCFPYSIFFTAFNIHWNDHYLPLLSFDIYWTPTVC